jgi:hypothetical protein
MVHPKSEIVLEYIQRPEFHEGMMENSDGRDDKHMPESLRVPNPRRLAGSLRVELLSLTNID